MFRLLLTLCVCLLITAAPASADKCPFLCNCSIPKTVDCSNWRFFKLPDDIPPDTETLLLDHNNITTLPDGELAKVTPKLIYFSMSYNGNSDKVLTNRTFENLPFLSILNIAGDKIFDFPLYVPKQIKFLNFSENSVNTFDNMRNYTEIQTLILESNNIFQVGYNDFSAQVNLENLDLTSNSISSISAGAFRNNKKLTLLKLGNNQLTSESLSPGTFGGLDTLDELILDNNPLSRVPVLPSSVTQLLLRGTELSALSEGDLAGMPQLQQLHLNTTGMLRLDPGAFSGLAQLQVLSLSDARLSPDVLGPGLLFGLEGLTELHLSRSSVSALLPGVFEYCSKLRVVHAAEMQLSHLDHSVVAAHNFTSFILEHNPLWCDCNLRWLKELSSDPKMLPAVGDPHNLICSYPARLKGQPFSVLSPGDFQC